MLVLNNITLKTPENKTLVSGVTWHIKRGENWILFGRNGSGKTKLLEIITGYQYPSEGEVIRFGQKQLGSDIRDIRRRIGYISTSLKDMFYFNERAIDVVLSGIYASTGMYVEPAPQEVKTAEALLSGICMAERAFDDFGIFSDGEKQKILMLRAFISKPEILIFDEPAKGLDIPSREDLLQAIMNMSKNENTSIIYVTHHTEEIIPIFSRIFMIDRGKMSFNGDIEKGLRSETVSSLFGRNITIHKMNGRYYSMLG